MSTQPKVRGAGKQVAQIKIASSYIRFTLTILLALAGVLIAPHGWAATFYVDNSCAANGNGTSTTCGPNGPWNSLANAAQCAGMGAGDVMEIRAGKGAYNEGWSWQPRCTGTTGNHITVQNYAGENVLIEGTLDISKSTWSSVGNGVYQCTGSTCGTQKKFPFTAWYNRGAGEEQLNLVQSNQVCDSSVPAGQMRYSNGQVCAHLSDNSNPGNATYFKIPYVYTAIQLNFTAASYLTLRKNPAGGSFVIRRFRDTGITTTTVNREIYYDGLDIGWVMDRCIDQSEGGVVPAGYRITNNKVHHCGQEGIRWSQDSSPNGIVQNNEVYEIQTTPLFEKCMFNCQTGFTDHGSAIRVANNQNGRINNNIIHNVGGGLTARSTGIDLEGGGINTVVENNYLYAMNTGDTSNGQTNIAILLQTPVSTDTYTSIIRNNRIYQADTCFSVDAGGTLASTSTIDFINNTCQDPRDSGVITGMDAPNILGTVNWVNNIFSAIGSTPRTLIDLAGASISGFQLPKNNVFYCPTCSNLIYWISNTYQASNVGSFGTGNRADNPNLSLSGTVPTLNILSPSGAAYNNGIYATNAPTTDYTQITTRPQLGAYDIGAHEFNTSSTLSPPVNLRFTN